MENHVLGTKPIPKLLLEMALPAMVAMGVNALYNFVDRLFVSKVNSLALAGVGISMPIQIMLMSFVLLIGVGASVLVSLNLGKNEKESSEKILANSATYLFITLSITSLLSLFFLDDFLKLMGTSKHILPYAHNYTKIILIGSPIGLLGFGLTHSLRAQGDSKFSMYVLVFSAILNVILDPIFIFVFKMGVSGAALATIISQIVPTLIILHYFCFNKKSILHLKTSNLIPDLKILKSIIENGFPIFVMQIVATFLNTFLNRSLSTYGGDLAISAMTIISSIFQTYHMIIVGIVQGNQPIVGYNFGANKYDRVSESLILSIKISTIISLVAWIGIFFFPKTLSLIFTKDPTLLEMTVYGMKVYLGAIPLIGFQLICSQYFQAVSLPKISTLLLLLRFGLLLFPLILILAPRFGVNGIWYSGLISDLIAFAVTLFFFIKEVKRLNMLHKKTESTV